MGSRWSIVPYVASIGLVAGFLIGRQYYDATTGADLRRANETIGDALDAHRQRRQVEDGTGLRIVGSAQAFSFTDRLWHVKGGAIDEETFLPTLSIVLRELKRYPIATFEKVGVTRVVLCRELTLGGKPVGGFPEFDTSTLYLGIADYTTNSVYQRQSVHHEMYHLIDHAIGRLATDAEWLATNAAEFRYAGSGFTAAGENQDITWTSSVPGFVSTYSRSAMEEDKAEIFAWLMTDPNRMRLRAASDPIVASKVKLIQARIAELGKEFTAILKPR